MVIVVAGIAVPDRQIHEGVVDVVGRPVGRVRMLEVAAGVGRHRADRDPEIGEIPVLHRGVVEPGLPWVDDHRQAGPSRIAVACKVVMLRPQPWVHPAQEAERCFGARAFR